MRETWVQPLGWEDLLEKRMGTHSSILAWRILWTEEPDELQSMGSQRVRHNWMTNTHTRRHTTPSRTNTYKKCPFHHRGLECKNRKSRDTQNNKQVCPWHTKWEVLLGKHAGHSKYLLPTTQEKTLYTHGHHLMANTKIRLIILFAAKMEKLYTVSKNKTRSCLWPRS